MEEEEPLSPISAWVYRQLEGRETLKWLVSHVFIYVGMVVLICGYCIIGAFTFQYLENSAIHEKRAKEGKTNCWEDLKAEVLSNRTLVLHQLYNRTYEEILSSHAQTSMKDQTDKELQDKLDKWLFSVKKIVLTYEDFLESHQERKAHCKEELAVGDDWEFQTALLFASTVVTTIGYGNRTPQSWRGRLCTLLYAMLGVPLMLFCLRTLGRSIGHGLDMLYNMARDYAARLRGTDSDDESEEGYASPMAHPHQDSDAAALPSIALTSESAADNPRLLAAPDGADGAGSPGQDQHRGSHSREQAVKPSARALRIPLAVVFLITTLYSAIGAALFSHYERWSYLDGFYFTFITLSTIGFGDLVPRVLTDEQPDYHGTPSWWVETSYVLYVMVGLTVIQMSFELTRETINQQFYDLGRSVGVLDREHSHAKREARRESRRQSRRESRRPTYDRRKSSRRHRDDSTPGGLLKPPFSGGRLSSLGGGSRSPSMRSAEMGPASNDSAGSAPPTERPRSARPRRPDHGPD
ncbi:TWiK family of potassium channels protein 7-like isoform X1 [Amphibalanus amphitrite]|uniref:TWiK family of potassium channels protein 7-like isoform X1 n=2 Tax=Amphibalanus amphitrite TaxID=1232801 RepID=UPI001C902152|nr:TWiK family of potassium channels protein 7-like isoform X1 [Amphibalanus amphitrite]